MAEILLGGKRLSELKVTELKEELDKRGLSKKGVKTVLVTRLKNAILKEELESQSQTSDGEGDASTADSSMDQSQIEETLTPAPPHQPVTMETTNPSPDAQQSTEDPLASTPTATPTTEPELANQLVDEQSHDTPATLPSNEASLEEGRGTPVMDESHERQEFIPLGSFDEEPIEEEPVPAEDSGETSIGRDEVKEEQAEEQTADQEKPGNDEEATETEESKDDSERRDSVLIDPSYAPEGEELLYEGDVDETRAEPVNEGVNTEETKEDGFIVHLHDTSMEIEFDKKATAKPAATDAGQSSNGNKESSQPSLSSDCHLWVKGLSPSVRALDLQTLFSPYGKVVTAKVVAKAQSRNQRFGYVTMATSEEAQKCITELNQSELKGQKITVEVAKNPPPLSAPSPKATPTDTSKSDRPTKKPSPRLVRKAQDKGSEVKPARKSLESGVRRRSPKQSARARSHSRERPRVRGRSPPQPRRSPPIRRSPPPRRSPPIRRYRSPSPPFRDSIRNRLGPRNPDRREVAMRRDVDRGRSDHLIRETQRQVEARLQERRLAQEREQEIARRHMEAERSRQQQEMARRVAEMRDREARERDMRERQAAERERAFRERERELREREVRERQRREALEKQLREREMREAEFREREKRLKDAYERDLRDKEMKAIREKEARERDARMHTEREREYRERERKLKEEADRIEAARRMQREEASRIAREREEFDRANRERKIMEEKRKQQEDEIRAKREEEKQRAAARVPPPSNQRAPQPSNRTPQPSNRATPTSGGRLGKRSYDDGAYDGSSKRPAIADYSGSSPSSVFGRLEPLKREASSNQAADLYRRGNDSFERHGGYSSGAGRYGNDSRGSSYQTPTSSALHQSAAAALFGKSPLPSSPVGRKPDGVSLAGVTPEVMSAAAQVLQNINKQVGLQNLPLANRTPPVNVAAQLQQIAAANPMAQGYDNVAPFSSGFGGAGFMGGKKLPPEGERYNRRVGGGRSGHHGNMRGNLFKGGRM